jgi:tripartite-type tricarboxylate transporter receptor subunit TctC
MITRRDIMTTGLSATLAPALLRGASAQEWPTRFVRLIVPFPPGGGTDAVARIVTTKLSELWGQQVVIENRGGAGSNIGNEAAARAEGDGYTMLFGTLPLAVNRFIYASLPYDPIADLAPVSMLCRYPNLMAVPNSSHVKSVQEFIAHAKMNPGLTFGSSGIGTSPHLCGELFKRMAGLTMTHVPYRGAGPALNDLIPGRIDMMFNTMGAMLPQVRSGQIRGLAVTTAERFFTAPELPTIAESGVPGYESLSWSGIAVAAGTPKALVERLNKDINTVLAMPEMRQKLAEQGADTIGGPPEVFTKHIAAEREKWSRVIKTANIVVN